ncbi:MAG: class I SAM-dependent methyltransferase [Bacteroidetes bacterium]|nr:class I SAM-dependent methyltransferase [Bacteroidota bacterium]
MSTISLTTSRSRPGFYKQVILKRFNRMSKGRLDLLLPGGETITIGDGQGTHAQIQIRDNEFFRRCMLYGDIGFGKAYVDGLWDTNNVSAVLSWLLLNIDKAPRSFANNCPLRPPEYHELSNEFFRIFLDPSMTYSGAYFERDGMDLEEAQLAKYKRLCEQLRLRSTDHVLEIGCGWGSNALYIARNYGCQVTSLTLSQEQFKIAAQRVKKEGLEHLVTIRLEDYRNLSGRRFDKIVSVEMLEATRHRQLSVYFHKCNDLLKPNGILALQVVTCPRPKRIFSGNLLPSVGAINAAVNRTREMFLVDAKELGLHYAATLKVWFMQFNSHLAQVRALGLDERFIRKWNYYLCYCEAAFRLRNIHVMQLVYSRPNNTAQ